MNFNKSYLAIFFLLLISCQAQKKDVLVEKLSQKYCKAIENIEMNGKSHQVILEDMLVAAKTINSENTDLIKTVRKGIAQEIKSTDEKKIGYAFATDFVTNLMEKCPSYLKMARTQITKLKETNGTVEYVSKRVKGFLEEWKDMPFNQLYKRANDSIITSIDYSNSYFSDYKSEDQWTNIKPITDIHVHLLNTSDTYFKAFLVNEQSRAMGLPAEDFPQARVIEWEFQEID
ncbi:hypothetical protein [Zobellia alginiliquefaciens]|uniref:hypothetical protein n=1 Tax=Zobellia alginiliquefaciens TaxID=3032586 RepID=UPI0023E46F02|nr:hypothetical protein [Zobellia alginiliquefaciens]